MDMSKLDHFSVWALEWKKIFPEYENESAKEENKQTIFVVCDRVDSFVDNLGPL